MTGDENKLEEEKKNFKSLLDTISASRTYLLSTDAQGAPDSLKRCVRRKIYQTNGTTLLTGLLTLILTAVLVVLLLMFIYRSGRLPLPFGSVFREDPVSFIVYGLTGACLLVWLFCVVVMVSTTNDARIKSVLREHYVSGFDKLMSRYNSVLDKKKWKEAPAAASK